MTVRGVARILARTVGDWCRGVVLCVTEPFVTAVNLRGAIHDAFAQDDPLAGRDKGA